VQYSFKVVDNLQNIPQYLRKFRDWKQKFCSILYQIS